MPVRMEISSDNFLQHDEDFLDKQYPSGYMRYLLNSW